jgi:hypothetical protein
MYACVYSYFIFLSKKLGMSRRHRSHQWSGFHWLWFRSQFYVTSKRLRGFDFIHATMARLVIQKYSLYSLAHKLGAPRIFLHICIILYSMSVHQILTNAALRGTWLVKIWFRCIISLVFIHTSRINNTKFLSKLSLFNYNV